jgi:hypothetical protein
MRSKSPPWTPMSASRFSWLGAKAGLPWLDRRTPEAQSERRSTRSRVPESATTAARASSTEGSVGGRASTAVSVTQRAAGSVESRSQGIGLPPSSLSHAAPGRWPGGELT